MLNNKEQYLHISSYILNDVRLDPTKKILLSYIISLSKTSKGCYASNERFGELLSINSDGASKQISKLKRLGYIETKRLYKNSKEYRYIKVLSHLNDIDTSQRDVFINIPYSILLDINLSSTQKLILSEIVILLKLPEGCYKSNNDFGKLLGIGGGGVSKQIKKLVDMNYIKTDEIKKGNATDYRKIELGTSYTTRKVLPKSLGGTSQMTRGVLPTRLEGTSCRNTITTVYISKETLPVLAQFTSTEKIDEMSEIEILEQKIIDSCPRGLELLEHVKIKPVDNIWNFVTNKEELCNALSLIKQFKDASNKPLNEDVSVTNGIDEV
jgi:Mn-dependent DtxR family transcriptional regulator